MVYSKVGLNSSTISDLGGNIITRENDTNWGACSVLNDRNTKIITGKVNGFGANGNLTAKLAATITPSVLIQITAASRHYITTAGLIALSETHSFTSNEWWEPLLSPFLFIIRG